jgi:MoxR-like ATPase
VIVGQDDAIDLVLISLFTGGHCLITGVPGLAKTRLVRSLAEILDLRFKRIQFTPDLMPADITGTEILEETAGKRTLKFNEGPIFAQMILADEINRTPPKTQSALLEAMEEQHVTVSGRTYPLTQPFYVVTATTGEQIPKLDRVLDGEEILAVQRLVRRVPVAEEVARYAVQLVDASRPGQPNTPEFVNKWVKWGASLRASQALILGGKARALIQGRYHVSLGDIRALAPSILRHRIVTNFYAESDDVDADTVVARLLETVATPASGM